MNAKDYFNFGNTLRMQGKLTEAAAAYREAIALRPEFYEPVNSLGVVLKDLGGIEQAIGVFRRGVELRPTLAEAWNHLGIVLARNYQADEAAAAYLQAIRFKPDDASAYRNLAITVKNRGDITRAIALMRKGAQLAPANSGMLSGMLYMLYFQPGMTKGQLNSEHREWAKRHVDPLKAKWKPHGNSRDPDRRLRIGYVSPDFRIHPVGRFILPLFVEHDRGQVETFCYSAVRSPDDVTAKIKSYANQWREIRGMPDEEAAELIRADGIDILVDLCMHMGDSRLGVFARKPAPVQATYLAYAGTTGLDAIDYRITDPYLDPPGATGEDFCEKPIRLESYWVYKPSIWDVEPGPPPAVKNGFVTFGCLNNFCKISSVVWETWIELLRASPNFRLMIHAHEGSHRDELREAFTAAGIVGERINFVGMLPLPEYMRQYQQIDIALDTFPYTGGTTTCDALWMGVPVVTLRGDLAVSRSGVSLLSNVGLTELIAGTRQEYVAIAVGLAKDIPRLEQFRATIREKLTRSRLMDAQLFARDMERAYREMWVMWCDCT